MGDMSAVIIPKSDQLNSDSLMSGPLTIKITKVLVRPGTEQPVSIFYEGDEAHPWKPCKSMARVLVAAWGPDSSQYVGRSLTLYRDPKVKWGGLEIGGLRISHMSDITGPLTLALTETKQSRKPFTVKLLAAEPKKPSTPTPDPTAPPPDPATLSDWADAFEALIDTAPDYAGVKAEITMRLTSPEWAAFKVQDEGRAREIYGKFLRLKGAA